MDGVVLPPDLERFAAEAVASGRYQDLAEIVRAGVELLRRREQARAGFVQTLEDASAEADRDGWIELDQLLADGDRIIDAAVQRQA